MASTWETVGAARYAAGMIRIVVGLDRFVIAATDAPKLIMEGADCDVWQEAVSPSSEPIKAGRAGWSAEGRMLVVSLPGKHGLVQVVGRAIVKHYIERDRRPVNVVMPPAPAPMVREPTRAGAVVRAV